jgi:hypothetical protein
MAALMCTYLLIPVCRHLRPQNLLPAAHNNIQVTRKVLNWQGKAVPRHLVEQLSAMERLLRDAGHAGAHSSKQSSPAGKAGGEGPDGAGMAGPQLATSVVGQ